MTAARHLQPSDPHTLLSARVALRDGQSFCLVVEDEGRDLVARRAASCLLAPEPGDRVVVALTPEPFILAVLVRHGERAAEIGFVGDARIVASGRLELRGEEELGLRSRGAVSLLSRALGIRTGRTELFSQQLDAVVQRARSSFDELGIVSRLVDRVSERVSERAERVYRFVGELDQLRARHLDYRAAETAQLKGDSTVVTARQVVKVDGEQVHIG